MPDQKVMGKDNEDKGRTSKESQGQDGQGRARTCLGQDGQGQFTGRMDKGLRWAGQKIAGCQLVWVSPGLDTQTKMAQHSLRQSYPDTLDYKQHSLGKQNILPANLDYKRLWLQDSPGMKAKLSTVTACPGHQRPSNGIYGQD